MWGHLHNLPPLNTGRRNHACSGYRSATGKTVFIVVGGRDPDEERYLDSSEQFTAGDLTWTNLARLETGGSSLLYLSRL